METRVLSCRARLSTGQTAANTTATASKDHTPRLSKLPNLSTLHLETEKVLQYQLEIEKTVLRNKKQL